MDARNALKFAVVYHGLALVASLAGILVAGLGILLGFRGSLAAISLTEPTSIVAAAGTSGLVIAGLGVVVGLYVRRVGQSAARIHVGARALDEGLYIPSTSVTARKVGREVSEEVAKAIEGSTGTGEAGFEYAGGQESRSGGEAESAALD